MVDATGKVMLETAVVTDPDAIKAALMPYLSRLRGGGHEAGSLSPWPHPGLLGLGLPATYLETLHVRAALKAQRNKTDRAGRPRHRTHHAHRLVPAGAYQERGLLPAAAAVDPPAQLKRKFLDLSIWMNRGGRGGFAQAVREAVVGDALVGELIDAMLNARAVLWKGVWPAARSGGLPGRRPRVVRRSMQIPGVVPVATVSFMTAVDDPLPLPPLAPCGDVFWSDAAALALRHVNRRATSGL
ncbi:transposase [Bradyrhizobium sp. USDA 4461]